MPCTSLILQSIPSYNSRLDEMLQTEVPSGITPSYFFNYNKYMQIVNRNYPIFSFSYKSIHTFVYYARSLQNSNRSIFSPSVTA